MKCKIIPTENLEHHIVEILSKNYFHGNKYQLICLNKFTKHINRGEHIFHKWVKSDFNYNHSNNQYSIRDTILQNLDDEQLEESGFKFREREEAVLEIYKVNDFQASSYVELPEEK